MDVKEIIDCIMKNNIFTVLDKLQYFSDLEEIVICELEELDIEDLEEILEGL